MGKHRHDHGSNASVPAKGNGPAIPPKHWEMFYDPTPKATNTPSSAFLPKCGKDRPQPHNKINECDH